MVHAIVGLHRLCTKKEPLGLPGPHVLLMDFHLEKFVTGIITNT
jgi:hypothetical protein